jgi:hypothetical protein
MLKTYSVISTWPDNGQTFTRIYYTPWHAEQWAGVMRRRGLIVSIN